MTHPLSTRLDAQADQLQQLAHLAATLDARVSNALILHAARLALASLAARTLERDLCVSQRTADELARELTADTHRAQPAAPDIHTRQRYDRIIAGILDGGGSPGCHLGRHLGRHPE